MSSLEHILPPDTETSSWHGFRRHDFTYAGARCIVCEPASSGTDRPWIWRARFFAAWPALDLALLAAGFHLVHIDVADLFGNQQARHRWDRFHALLSESGSLNPRPVLEGFSRGGLAVYHWAAQNPDKTGCIYADAPVCDMRSWPGGRGCGNGSPADWSKCLAAHGLSETQARHTDLSILGCLPPLAKAGIPIIHVCGDADATVPYMENTARVETRYRELGGLIRVIHKPSCGHHPHSLEDVSPLVAFIETYRLG